MHLSYPNLHTHKGAASAADAEGAGAPGGSIRYWVSGGAS